MLLFMNNNIYPLGALKSNQEILISQKLFNTYYQISFVVLPILMC